MKVADFFIQDFIIEDLLYALTLRSPIAKGQLVGIECPPLPSGYTLVTAADIPGTNRMEDFPVKILADTALNYIGEPIALLVGAQEEKLEELAGLCRINAREDEPVFALPSLAMLDAIDSSNEVIEIEAGDMPETIAKKIADPIDCTDSIFEKRTINCGTAQTPCKEAAAVLSGTYYTGIQEHCYHEAHGAVAIYSMPSIDTETIQVFTATQWPFQVKRNIAAVLKMESDRIDVTPTRIGKHMDGKIWYPSLLACHAALASYVTGEPVKLMLTREEDFRYSPKRNSASITISSSHGALGELLSLDVSVVLNLGAQPVFGQEILDRSCLGALGFYKVPSIKVSGYAVKTNIPPQGPFTGFGLAQGFFAIERHISRMSETLGIDPITLRERLSLKRGDKLAIGVSLRDNPPIETLLAKAAASCDFKRKWASYELLQVSQAAEPIRKGIGIAAAYQGSGFLYPSSDNGEYAVEITMGKDGGLEIQTSMVSENQEYVTLWQAIASEILSIDPSLIVLTADSDDESPLDLPDSGPATLSRNISCITQLVERCCTDIRKQRFRDPLPITVRRSWQPLRAMNWDNRNIDTNAFANMGWGAAIVEVCVDRVSYTPQIRGIWLTIDGGKLLSEKNARTELITSSIQALGWACLEDLDYEAGEISDFAIQHYQVPVPSAIPPIHIEFINTNDTVSRGLGELPFNIIPAAYVQAVSQAMDHPFNRIPLRPRDIWAAEALQK